LNILDKIDEIFKSFVAYISFFDVGTSISENREVKPIRLEVLINRFIDIVKSNSSSVKSPDFHGYNLYTIPMHPSEWYSILFNLYSNSLKAIKRAEKVGKIKLIAGVEKENLYIEFLDDGDGIPLENRDKIFNAFFSTSNPVSATATEEEELTGRGLGLKIVKDTLSVYGGTIELVDSPLAEYNTCFRIEIPKASNEQLKNL